MTLPLSLLVLLVDPATGTGLLLTVALCGIAQAALLRVVLRGRRVDRSEVQAFGVAARNACPPTSSSRR